MKSNKLYYLIQLVLIAGVIVAFFAVYQDFMRFYEFEGVWFKFKDCETVHPFLTPCFWGAFAFLGALVWNTKIILKKNVEQYKKLMWFLIGGTLFAWGNFSRELYKFYKASGQEYIGCSGAKVSNPFLTPCFYGSFLFLMALIVTYFINKKLSEKSE